MNDKVSGSIVARIVDSGNVEIGTTHRGGLVTHDGRVVIQRADVVDVVLVLSAIHNGKLHDGELLRLHAEKAAPDPIPMVMTCPACGERHVDTGEFAHKPHHTHACQSCGMVWRPAIVPTVGVQLLPGFKD